MLDRFLVIAEANELPAIICANKVDLTGIGRAREVFGLYADIGYSVIYVSAKTGEGISVLADALTDMISVFTGPSGVGKSSLLNALDPTLSVQIGDLREVRKKGRHTTRAAQLYSLPLGENTYVADTPGIRELGLYDMEALNLGFYFREFAPYIHSCRYPNCTHDHEPGCAIRAAMAAGAISRARYESYLRLVYGEDA
jgi:ribosome biogenesis GTPase